MRCERCNFENIPGQDTCIKCGSALLIKNTAVDIYPPRMSKWKKPFRDFLRSMRKGKIVPQIKANQNSSFWPKDLFSDKLIGLLLCIVPGLAHLVNKRFKEIRYYFAAWLILLLVGLFCYGSTAGFICIGLAIGLHAGITIQYGLFKELVNLREKIAMLILILIGLTSVYYISPQILFPNLVGRYSSLTIPYYNVIAGDYLLARSNLNPDILLPRGSLVSVHPLTIGGHNINTGTRNINTTIGEIVGLPGENIRSGIVKDVFIVNGQELSPEQYPVPQWLQNRDFFCTIPNNSYFVSMRYNVAAHGIRLTNTHINEVCLIRKNEIEARAFLRWWPLARRGFLP